MNPGHPAEACAPVSALDEVCIEPAVASQVPQVLAIEQAAVRLFTHYPHFDVLARGRLPEREAHGLHQSTLDPHAT